MILPVVAAKYDENNVCSIKSHFPMRFWRVREYLIIYRSEKQPIEIVRVLPGKRDLQALLE
jgi:plasmid stabilization system protein ParE